MFASRTRWLLTPNRLAAELEAQRHHGRTLLDLTESNPTRCGFKFDAREILAALADPRGLAYQPDPRGLLPAREAVAAYYQERGVAVALEQIFLTTSTSEAYSYVFRLLADPGCSILVPQPSYPLFDFLADLNDLEVVPYPLVYDDRWQIDLRALAERRAENSRAVVVVHPNNPTGSFVRREELASLMEVCAQNGVAIVADEVFADYALAAPEDRVASHAAASGALTFTLSGLSKISALPQMKLAWIVVNGPEKVRREALERLEVIADTYLSVSAPLAHALPRLLESRKTLQPQVLERGRENLRRLDELLARSSASRLHVEGGWYSILRLPRTRSDEEWALAMLREDGVIVHPGHFFDLPWESHIVISLLPGSAAFDDGVGRILRRVAGG